MYLSHAVPRGAHLANRAAPAVFLDEVADDIRRWNGCQALRAGNSLRPNFKGAPPAAPTGQSAGGIHTRLPEETATEEDACAARGEGRDPEDLRSAFNKQVLRGTTVSAAFL